MSQPDTISIKPISYSLTDAAKACGVSKATIERAVSAGDITVSKIGRRVVVPVWALETWIMNNTRKVAR